MKDPGRPTQSIPVLIGVIAALLSSFILKGYPIGFFSRMLITIGITVIVWYIFRLLHKSE